MKKYLFILSTIICSMLFVFLIKSVIFAQLPSFELYSSSCGVGKNCKPYPSVDAVSANKYQNFISITGHVFDVSGVSSVVANIEDPSHPGQYMNVEYPEDGDGVMHDDGTHDDGGAGDGIYGAVFGVSASVVFSQTVSEYSQASLSCPSGDTISSFTSKYGTNCPGGPINCGSCAIGSSSCSVNFDNTSCGSDPCPGISKEGQLSITCGSGASSAWDPNATYWVDISATDNLLNNSMAESSNVDYNHKISFKINNVAVSTSIVGFLSSAATPTAGDTINLFATLEYTGGTFIPGETLTFTDVTNPSLPVTIGTATTGSTGSVNISYHIMGSVTLRVDYAGNAGSGLPPCQSQLLTIVATTRTCSTVNNATICIYTPPPPVTNQISSFTVSPTSANIGDTVTLSAHLSGAGAGELISFRDNTSGYNIGTATTNSSGNVTMPFTVYGTAFGSRTLGAIYNGKQSLALPQDYQTANLTITTSGPCSTVNNATICIYTPPPPVTNQISSFTVSPTSANIGDTVTLSAHLSGAGAGELISFRDNTSGYNIGTATTNSSGNVTMPFTVDSGNFGSRTLSTTYTGKLSLGLLASYKQASLNIPISASAAVFNGNGSYIDIPGFKNVAPTQEITISFWAKTSLTGWWTAFAFSSNPGNNRISAHPCYADNNTYWDFGDIGSGGRAQVANPSNCNNGSWHHYVLESSKAGNFMKIYYDGSLKDSESHHSNFSGSSEDFQIGGTSGSWFNGSIDEFMVFNRILSGTEITNLFNSGNGVCGTPASGLVAAYHLDGLTADYSGNGNNGTNNGVTFTPSTKAVCSY